MLKSILVSAAIAAATIAIVMRVKAIRDVVVG